MTAKVAAYLRAGFAEEGERGTAFVAGAVCIGTGALAYFLWPWEPGWPLLVAMALISGALLYASRGRPAAGLLAGAFVLLVTGALAGKAETWRKDTQMLGSAVTTRATGHVARIEHLASGRVRLTIDLVSTERPRLRHAPGRIRVTAREIPQGLGPGDGVGGVVRLMPVSGPLRPQSYDFSFQSYFAGRGAIGFFLTGPERVALEPPHLSSRVAAQIERLRETIAARIRARLDGTSGEIAVALIAGIRGGIPEPANEALRVAGLAHVLAISGLHMALVTVTVMGGLRLSFAFFPGFASRYPVKKYAAAGALMAAAFYLTISGAEVAARRSFIMLAVMLTALLFDQAAITMRNLAIAAGIVLLWSPHEVLGPSFHMSFAATAALVAGYAAWSEFRARRPAGRYRDPPIAVKAGGVAWRFVTGLALTSIIAGGATALYGAWHFERISPLTLVSNLAAMPVVSLMVMPGALFGALLMPFGLEGPGLRLMGTGIDLTLAIASWIAERTPFDAVGQLPASGLVLMTLALAIATVSTGRLRLLCLPFLLAGALSFGLRELPHLYISEDGRLLAMTADDRRLAINRPRPNRFTLDKWEKSAAARAIVPRIVVDALPEVGDLSQVEFACVSGLCLARHGSGAVVGHAENADAARLACDRAHLVVIEDATVGRELCGAGATIVLTTRELARRGSATVMFRGGRGLEAEIRHAIAEPLRPWHKHRAFSRASRGLAERPSRTTASPRFPAGRETADAAKRRRSVAPNETDQPPLHLDPVGCEDTGFVGGIGSLERNRCALAPEPLQRRFLVVDQRNHDVAGRGRLRVADDHRVAIENPGIDHRIALDLQRVVFTSGDHLRWDRHDMCLVLDRLDRNAGGDPAHYRNRDSLVGGGGCTLRLRWLAAKTALDDARREAPRGAERGRHGIRQLDHLQRARPVGQAPYEAALLERGNQPVNAGFRSQVQRILHLVE